jgi:flagellar biogenesis protein FliO
METLWRLAWALPLVLLVGAVTVLLLKRFAVPTLPSNRSAPRLTLQESLSVSDDTRLHLVAVDRRTFLVVESSRHAQMHQVSEGGSEIARQPARFTPPWVRWLYKARSHEA